VEITITGRHVAVTDALSEYINDKVEHMLHRFGREIGVTATVGIEGESHVVEMMASAGHKHDFMAEARGDNVYAVVDETVDRLDRQLIKFKEKRQDRRRRPAGEPGVRPDATEDEDDGVDPAELDS